MRLQQTDLSSVLKRTSASLLATEPDGKTMDEWLAGTPQHDSLSKPVADNLQSAAAMPPVVSEQQPSEVVHPKFLQHALEMAGFGVPISFLPAGQKGSNTSAWQNSATNDLEEIIRRAGSANRLNFACVAKAIPGGFLFLDDDGGIRSEYEKIHGAMIPTLKVRSCNGSFHYYFKHSAKSLDYFQSAGKAYIGEPKAGGKGELWSLRMDNAHVVGPGSIVKNNQQVASEYKIVHHAPIIEIPDSLLEFLVSRYGQDKKLPPSIHGDKIPRGTHDVELTRIAGKLRYDGMEESMLTDVLIEICEKRCEDYGDDYREMAAKIAHSVCHYPVAPPETPVLIGGKPAGSVTAEIAQHEIDSNAQQQAEQEAEDAAEIKAQIEEEEPLPDFPRLPGSLSDLADALYPDIPYEFKIMSAITHWGIMRSGIDTLENEPYLQPRFYTVLICRPRGGKTAAINEVRTHMRSLGSYGVVKSVDSGPALVDEFVDYVKALPPMVEDKSARLLLDPDEMRDVFEKAKVSPQSRNSMFMEFLKLYESNQTGNRSRKAGKTQLENAHLAQLGGATPQGYRTMWTGTSGNSDGLQSRYIPIGTNQGRMPVKQRPSDVPALLAAITRLQAQAKQPGKVIRFSPEADKMLQDWWDSCERDKSSEIRVTDMVKRLLIVLAVTNDTDIVGEDMMAVAIKWGNLLIACRDKYNPADSATWCQAFENDLEKVGRRHPVAMTLTEFRRLVHPTRKPGGIGPFLQAWKNCIAAGILVEAGQTHKGTKRYRVAGVRIKSD